MKQADNGNRDRQVTGYTVNSLLLAMHVVLAKKNKEMKCGRSSMGCENRMPVCD